MPCRSTPELGLSGLAYESHAAVRLAHNLLEDGLCRVGSTASCVEKVVRLDDCSCGYGLRRDWRDHPVRKEEC